MNKKLALLLMLSPLAIMASSRGGDALHEDEALSSANVIIKQDGDVQPWTHLRFNNDSDNFQFLIVSDRTGGHRNGVFPDALRKAELLQPEFIMSVGDLIEGYTESTLLIESQWDEFQGFTTGLETPFFYVPGNHDLSNPVMSRIWEERFGQRYYHFRYRDVLFLCLCSDDGKRANLSEEQIEYFRVALDENRDVRWNLVFIHRPLWIEDHYSDSSWTSFETLLGERDYTVFAGHNHTYTKHIRNDRKHIVLATTGGGSDLTGPDHGQFDHVAWITMTDAGPQIANLLLDGIWDEDIFTTVTSRLMTQLKAFRATPILFDEKGKLIDPPSIRFTNDEDVPIQVSIDIEPHPLLGKVGSSIDSVPPNSVMDLPLPLNLNSSKNHADFPPAQITIKASIEPVHHRRLELVNQLNLAVESLRTLPKSPANLQIDGELDEWTSFEFSTLNGDSPSSCDFILSRDDQNLYLAARVRDDFVLSGDPPAERWNHDYLELRIDPRPFRYRQNLSEQWDSWNAIYLACFPMNEAGPAKIYRRHDFPEEMEVMQRVTNEGYSIEVALPLSYIRERAEDPNLPGFTLNVTIVDYDDPDGPSRKEAWKPAWHLPSVIIGGGAFALD